MTIDTVHAFSGENISGLILDLFRIGTESATITLSWSIMYLAKYPDVQKQLRQEVDDVS